MESGGSWRLSFSGRRIEIQRLEMGIGNRKALAGMKLNLILLEMDRLAVKVKLDV